MLDDDPTPANNPVRSPYSPGQPGEPAAADPQPLESTSAVADATNAQQPVPAAPAITLPNSAATADATLPEIASTLSVGKSVEPLVPVDPATGATARDALAVAVAACEVGSQFKLSNIRLLSVGHHTSLAEYFVIMTGFNRRQIQTIADDLTRRCKAAGVMPLGVEGFDLGWWVLVDLADVIVHVFHEDAREYYDLDLHWGDGIDLPVDQGVEAARDVELAALSALEVKFAASLGEQSDGEEDEASGEAEQSYDAGADADGQADNAGEDADDKADEPAIEGKAIAIEAAATEQSSASDAGAGGVNEQPAATGADADNGSAASDSADGSAANDAGESADDEAIADGDGGADPADADEAQSA